MVKTAIILAGGLGTRLKKTVPNLPKPMAPINGRPFLEYQMDFWIEQGINRFILSVGYLKHIIIEHFGDSYQNCSIEYAAENNALGTGGAMLLASTCLTEPFLVLNGDTYIELDLNNFYDFHIKKKSQLTLSLFKTSNLERYMGVNIDSDKRIVSLIHINNSSNYCMANGGVYLVEPSLLSLLKYNLGIKLSLEDELLPNIIENGGRVFGSETNGKFIDIGLPEDYLKSTKIIN